MAALLAFVAVFYLVIRAIRNAPTPMPPASLEMERLGWRAEVKGWKDPIILNVETEADALRILLQKKIDPRAIRTLEPV